MPRIRRAIISVSDKRGLLEFAQGLRALGIEIISTGGTFTALQEHGIEVRQVSDVTNFPEILDGRVKTLHPRIHGGLLAVLDNPDHMQQLEDLEIAPIDMVVVNLYPFEQTAGRDGIRIEEAVEQIDIGGPAMIRSAAKNYRHKAVLVRPEQYPPILEEMRTHNAMLSEATCFALAKEVFAHTSHYDGVISRYLEGLTPERGAMPEVFTLAMRKDLDLRYGENPHQQAALYGRFQSVFQKLHGKDLSYNNIVDIASAAAVVSEFDLPTVAIIKHTNPCGAGSADTIAEAYEKALATDPSSAFGGIVAMNRPLDLAAAEAINRIFTEVIVAPDFLPGVVEMLASKKDRRLIRQTGTVRNSYDLRSVPGGILVQSPDAEDAAEYRVVSRRHPTEEENSSMLFAWRIARHVKSNAIVYATSDRTIGIGAGQMSRVDSSRIAVLKARAAGLETRGTAVASDAFFPFADGLLEAVAAGSVAVIQPGGSKRDAEVIEAADKHNITMVFTGTRHFTH